MRFNWINSIRLAAPVGKRPQTCLVVVLAFLLPFASSLGQSGGGHGSIIIGPGVAGNGSVSKDRRIEKINSQGSSSQGRSAHDIDRRPHP